MNWTDCKKPDEKGKTWQASAHQLILLIFLLTLPRVCFGQPFASNKSDSGLKRSYFVQSRSSGTRRETEPPRYVRELGNVEDWLGEDLSGIDFGIDYRLRYEYRDDDIRRPGQVLDDPFLTRTRLYLGVREVFDPVRGYVEFGDARKSNGRFPEDDRDINEMEFIQAVGELYFDDAFSMDRPFRIQAGRMAFEYLDRRLLARNQWRNTTNNFEGFRAIWGEQSHDWQVDWLAVQPVERLLTRPDRVDEERWLYGIIGDWRRWSDVVTLQPFYLGLDQNGKEDRINRFIHTLGLRGYGVQGERGWDYDAQAVVQFGKHGDERHEAFAFTTEVGYTMEHHWKPRFSGFLGYASGDRNPEDDVNQRFERLFGFARPWSANDYITWDNLIAPKARIEFWPKETICWELGYSAFWLASRTDEWKNAQLRDSSGQSGSFMGQELHLCLSTKIGSRTDVNFGYAHFIPGGFPRALGKGKDTDFFYLEFSPRLFK